MLRGDNYEYYGRCECADGYYKPGFNETTCKKDEYIKDDWDQYRSETEKKI